MTPDQARQLLDYVDENHATGLAKGYDVYGLLIHVLLGTGLRKGEALALTWGDLDGWSRRGPTRLQVRRSLKIGPRGATFTDKPKTGRSRRTMFVPQYVASKMAPWRRGESDLVFANRDGNHLDPNNVTRRVKAITTAAGIGPWTPHELRHSAASLLLSAGVPLKIVCSSDRSRLNS